MSYLVLARKWRPKNFSEMVGQEHVLRALSNGLQQQRLHHAYLFSGTRGIGQGNGTPRDWSTHGMNGHGETQYVGYPVPSRCEKHDRALARAKTQIRKFVQKPGYKLVRIATRMLHKACSWRQRRRWRAIGPLTTTGVSARRS